MKVTDDFKNLLLFLKISLFKFKFANITEYTVRIVRYLEADLTCLIC